MCTYLAWFVVESRGVFTKSLFIKIFLSKINKKLLDLATSRKYFNYDKKENIGISIC